MINLTSEPATERTAAEKNIYWIAKGVAIAAAVVALCAAVLLAVSWKTVRDADAASTEQYETLVEHVEKNPGDDALRSIVRELDLVKRSAYFASKDMQKKATAILAVAGLLLAVSLRTVTAFGKHIPTPNAPESRDARLWSTVVLALIFFALLGMGYWFTRPPSAAAPVPVAVANDQTDRSDQSEQSPGTPELFWPAFRGYMGHPVVIDRTAPTEWTADDFAWQADISLQGYNSPIVWGDKVFVSGANAEERKVFAYDAATGKLLWETAISTTSTIVPEVTDDTGFAAATMACDVNFVYVAFANNDLAALDHSGKIVWSKNLGATDISYGFASSLQAADGILYVQRDVGKNSVVIAFNGADGKEVWRTGSRPEAYSWTSPVLARHGDKLLLIVSSPKTVEAFDAKNGILVWTAEGPDGELAPSPAISDTAVLVTMEYSGTRALALADGALLWEKDGSLDAPDICSPLVIGNRAYIPTSSGVLTCVNMEDGEVIWSEDGFRNGFHASPIAVGDVVYLTDMRGRVHSFRDNAEKYEEVGKGEIGAPTAATPAAVGGALYFRTNDKLIRVGK